MVAVSPRDYWLHPTKGNRPKDYLRSIRSAEGKARSRFLVSLFEKYVPRGSSALEVGCNVGRNLLFLLDASYWPVGIDLNEKAVLIANQKPCLYGRVLCQDAVNYLPTVTPGAFDIVFSMACLEHIPSPEVRVVCEAMRSTARRFVLTIEDEFHFGPRHFPRDYGILFQEALSMKQLIVRQCSEAVGLDESFVARVFEKV